MAINEDTSLLLRHVFVAAKSGGGKSQTMRNVVVPADGIRAVFWDPDRDHRCKHYTNRLQFLKALAAGDAAKKPFRVGWAGDDSQATFLWFCEAVWRILDGRFDTWVITEELADLKLPQDVPQAYGKLLKRGRKYGAIMVGNTQRIQEVPKTPVTGAAVLWVGLHEFQDAVYIEKMTGLNKADIAGLKPLNFYRKEDGEWTAVKVPYRKFGKQSGPRNQFNS